MGMLPTLKPALEATVICAMEEGGKEVLRKSEYVAAHASSGDPLWDAAPSSSPAGVGSFKLRHPSVPQSEEQSPTLPPALLVPEDEAPPKQASARFERDQFLSKFAHSEVFGEKGSVVTEASPKRNMRSRDELKYLSLNERLIMYPTSGRRFAWDGMSLALILFIAVELPFRLAFLFEQDTPVGWLIYDWFVLFAFAMDIVLNFRTGYVKDGLVVMDPRKIAHRYLRTWFLVDVISTVPWDWLFCASGDNCGEDAVRASAALSALRIFKLLRLLRLLRVTRIFRYLEQWEGTSVLLTSTSLRVIKLVSVMIMFTHWDGCMHYLIAQLESDGVVMKADSWPMRLESDLGISMDTPGQRYITSLFNAFSQMLCIGYGLVQPVRVSEIAMTLLSMVLGATLYGMFIASLTSFMADSEASAKQYNSQLDMLNQYMKHRQLPPELRVKLRTYLELCFPNKRAFNEDVILASLNQPLRKEVAWHKSRAMLERLPLYDSFDTGMMRALALALERVVFVEGDYILREGEFGTACYFIASGEVAVVTGLAGNHTEVTRLHEGAFFGEMALLDQAERHMASILVTSFCEAFMISRTRYRQLIRDYPSVREYLESVARLRLAAALQGSSPGSDLRSADLQTLVRKKKHVGVVNTRAGAADGPTVAKKRNATRRQTVFQTLFGSGASSNKGQAEDPASRSAPQVAQAKTAYIAQRRESIKVIRARRWSRDEQAEAVLSSAAAASALYGFGGDRAAERDKIAEELNKAGVQHSIGAEQTIDRERGPRPSKEAITKEPPVQGNGGTGDDAVMDDIVRTELKEGSADPQDGGGNE